MRSHAWCIKIAWWASKLQDKLKLKLAIIKPWATGVPHHGNLPRGRIISWLEPVGGKKAMVYFKFSHCLNHPEKVLVICFISCWLKLQARVNTLCYVIIKDLNCDLNFKLRNAMRTWLFLRVGWLRVHLDKVEAWEVSISLQLHAFNSTLKRGNFRTVPAAWNNLCS